MSVEQPVQCFHSNTVSQSVCLSFCLSIEIWIKSFLQRVILNRKKISNVIKRLALIKRFSSLVTPLSTLWHLSHTLICRWQRLPLKVLPDHHEWQRFTHALTPLLSLYREFRVQYTAICRGWRSNSRLKESNTYLYTSCLGQHTILHVCTVREALSKNIWGCCCIFDPPIYCG